MIMAMSITFLALLLLPRLLFLVSSRPHMPCPHFKNFVSKSSMEFQTTFNLTEKDFCKYKSCASMECSGTLPVFGRTTDEGMVDANFTVTVNACARGISVHGVYNALNDFQSVLKNGTGGTVVHITNRLMAVLHLDMWKESPELINVNATAQVRIFKLGYFRPIRTLVFSGTVEHICSTPTATHLPTHQSTLQATQPLTTHPSTSISSTKATDLVRSVSELVRLTSVTPSPQPASFRTNATRTTITPQESSKEDTNQSLKYIVSVGILSVVVVIGFYFWRKQRAVYRKRQAVQCRNDYDDDDELPIVP